MTPQLLTVIKQEALQAWSPEEWAKWWVEPKYDGARLIYHKGKFLSRTGKPLHNLDHLKEDLKGLSGWTLDGEVYGKNWADTMSVARASKTVKDNNGLRFAVFDGMADHEWEDRISNFTLEERYRTTKKVLAEMRCNFIHPVPHSSLVNDYEIFSLIHRDNLAAGCDGTVLKRWNSLYEFKRTKTWLKVKPIETYDCKVIGLVEGEGKHKGRMGALEILPEGSEVRSYVGTGFTDEERIAWWAWRRVGTVMVEVEARGVHPSGRLIEPRFIRIRGDK